MLRLSSLLLTLAFLVVVIGAGYFWINKESVFAHFISKKLHADVMIKQVKIGWDELEIRGLRIKNPKKSTLLYAFEGGSIKIQTPLINLWRDLVQIDLITIEDPTLSVEFYNSSGSDNNWSKLLRAFPATEHGKTFIIDKLLITNLQIKAMRANQKEILLPPLPRLEFDNLGGKHPLTLAQLGRVIFQSILSNLTAAPYLGKILDNVPSLPKGYLEGIESSLPERTRGAVKESLDMIRRKAENIFS